MRAFSTRLVGALWDRSPVWRQPLRWARLTASVLRHRLRAIVLGGRAPIRVVHVLDATTTAVADLPAIEVAGAGSAAFLDGQTESAATADGASGSVAVRVELEGDPGALPATYLESHLLAHAALDPAWTAAGRMAPSADAGSPSGRVHPFPGTGRGSHFALRSPSRPPQENGPVVGHVLGHVVAADGVADAAPLTVPATISAGPSVMRADVRPGAVIRQPVRRVDTVLARLPPVEGPRTALLTMPSLAVGGAERLLFDLLSGLGDRYRLLVATFEPHTAALGQTVDRCRRLTPHVYTLGDWLPREAHPGAVRHLLRRWRVETLVSWNGTVLFYDLAPQLRRERASLRIVAQLFDHRGGWTSHHGRRIVAAVDVHLAVNTPIARALERLHGVPADGIATVHHGVPVPPLPSGPERERRRRERRDELGVPQDATVVGTFIRMHRQKRPLDVIRLARRLEGSGLHFLLAGGGPLDRRVDSELERHRPSNLTRLPMRRDPERLYDAIDLCLMTSSYEGLPVFLLDGLARGLPAVAPAVGDIELLLGGGGGLAVERPGDLDALDAAIRSLADPDVRRRAGERGRETVAERFGVERYVRDCEQVIFPS